VPPNRSSGHAAFLLIIFCELRLVQSVTRVADKANSTGDRVQPAGMSKLISHVPPGQFLRYLLVGGWNTLFGYATFAALVTLLVPRINHGYILAFLLSNFIAITVAYLAYKFFVFRTQGNYLKEWLKCLTVYGLGIIPGLILLPLLVAALHYIFHLNRSGPYVAGAVLLALSTIYNFLGHRHFSFRSSDTRPGGQAL
jgi:putative flippase GtrA